jgi:16S rRNA (guanine966-N2)-methyltransferase
VTGGELRSRRLKVPPDARPTADRVRESLFMILTPRLPGTRVLDLYAGSGALGIEALSRGAASCVFVEASSRAARVLEANLAALGLTAQGAVRVERVERWLAGAGRRGEIFDLILLDPPYEATGVDRILADLVQFRLVAPGGLIAWEHDRRAKDRPADLELVDERRYGDTEVTLLRPAGG